MDKAEDVLLDHVADQDPKPVVEPEPKPKKKPAPKKKKPNLSVKHRYIKCWTCGQIYHKATKDFDFKAPPHPGMLELIDVYAELGWEQPPSDITLGYGCLRCANCDAPLAPSGKLQIQKLNWKELKNVLDQQL